MSIARNTLEQKQFAEVQQLLNDHEALVKLIESNSETTHWQGLSYRHWTFLLSQFKDPAHVRPVTNVTKNKDRTIIYNPAADKCEFRTPGVRGASKDTDQIKKTATTLLPKDGRIKLFEFKYCQNGGIKFPVGIMFKFHDGLLRSKHAKHKHSKYVFRADASTTQRKWVGYGNDLTDLKKYFCTVDDIRKEQNNQPSDQLLKWNEILARPRAMDIAAVFARQNTPTDRLNALHKKYLIQNIVQVNGVPVDVPAVILTEEKGLMEYTLQQQLEDIVLGLSGKWNNQSLIFATHIVNMIPPSSKLWEKLINYCIDNPLMQCPDKIRLYVELTKKKFDLACAWLKKSYEIANKQEILEWIKAIGHSNCPEFLNSDLAKMIAPSQQITSVEEKLEQQKGFLADDKSGNDFLIRVNDFFDSIESKKEEKSSKNTLDSNKNSQAELKDGFSTPSSEDLLKWITNNENLVDIQDTISPLIIEVDNLIKNNNFQDAKKLVDEIVMRKSNAALQTYFMHNNAPSGYIKEVIDHLISVRLTIEFATGPMEIWSDSPDWISIKKSTDEIFNVKTLTVEATKLPTDSVLKSNNEPNKPVNSELSEPINNDEPNEPEPNELVNSEPNKPINAKPSKPVSNEEKQVTDLLEALKHAYLKNKEIQDLYNALKSEFFPKHAAGIFIQNKAAYKVLKATTDMLTDCNDQKKSVNNKKLSINKCASICLTTPVSNKLKRLVLAVCATVAAFFIGFAMGVAAGIWTGPGAIFTGLAAGSAAAIGVVSGSEVVGGGAYVALRHTSLFAQPFEKQIKPVLNQQKRLCV